MSVFSQIPNKEHLFAGEHFFAIYDRYPVSPGHLLIISKNDKQDFFSLDKTERIELNELIIEAKNLIQLKFSPDGYNIGMNCGVSAGQTVMHFHCHVIPRYQGDMDNPRGGIRHCVDGKGYY